MFILIIIISFGMYGFLTWVIFFCNLMKQRILAERRGKRAGNEKPRGKSSEGKGMVWRAQKRG
jgi:hypothetical protein